MKRNQLLCTAISAIILFIVPLAGFSQTYDELNDQADKEYSADNYVKSEELATRAINMKPNARSYFIRADSRYSKKDYEAALDDYNTAISTYNGYYTTDKYKARLYYWRGRTKQNLGKYDDAISDFTTSLNNNYEEAGNAYWNRGNCYYKQQKYKESDDDYAKAIDRTSDAKDLSKLYKYRGDCQNNLGDYDNADKLFTRAISYNADNYNAYWSRGYLRNDRSKPDEALADYKKAVSIINATGADGKSVDLGYIYRNMARIYYTSMKDDEAMEAINKSLMANPNYADAFLTRANIWQVMKNYPKAKADYANAISLTSDDKVVSDLYFDRSYKLDWEILDYKSALEDLNKSISLDPIDAMKFWHRALTYDYKKDYPKALADCDKAIQLSGSNVPSGLYTLKASLKEKSGDIKGAVSNYQSALKIDDNNASIYYNLGRLFKTKLNNNDLAETNLSKAIEIAADDPASAMGDYAEVIKGNTAKAVSSVLEKVEKYRNDKYEYKWQLHNAACIYALSGNKAKALEYLDRSLAAGFDDYNHLVNDRDLVSLTTMPQYTAILVRHKVPQAKW